MVVNISISNRAVYSIIAIAIVVITAGIVFAYGTSNPAQFGHTASEIDGIVGGGGGATTLSCSSEVARNIMSEWASCPSSSTTVDLFCMYSDTGDNWKSPTGLYTGWRKALTHYGYFGNEIDDDVSKIRCYSLVGEIKACARCIN